MTDRNEKKILQFLQELSVKDLKQDTDKPTVGRSKKLVTKFVGLKKKPMRAVFKTKSGTPGSKRVWTQMIELPDLKEVLDDKSLSPKEKVRLGVAGDVKVTCNCPAFRYYGFQYINTQLETISGKGTNIYPKERNPDLRGSLCKHLHNALTVLPFYINDIAGKV